jgi:hypothetical protein
MNKLLYPTTVLTYLALTLFMPVQSVYADIIVPSTPTEEVIMLFTEKHILAGAGVLLLTGVAFFIMYKMREK